MSVLELNGADTAAVRDSFNHASLTDNATGDYTLAISSAMSNASYSRSGMSGHAANSQAVISQCEVTTAATTTGARYITAYANASLYDQVAPCVVLHGDLA